MDEPAVPFIAVSQRDDCVPLMAADVLAASPHHIDTSQALWTIGTDDSPVHQVVAAKFLPDGDVALLHDLGRTLDVFSGTTGSLITRVGSTGQGPGEFIQAFAVNVFSDGGITVPDYQNRRAVAFTPEFQPGETLPEPDFLMPGGSPGLGIQRGVTEDGAMMVTMIMPTETRMLSQNVSLQRTAHYQLLLDDPHRPDTLSLAWDYQGSVDGVPVLGLGSGPRAEPEISGHRVAWVEPDGLSISILNPRSDSITCVEWLGPVQTGSPASDSDSGEGRAEFLLLREEAGAADPSQPIAFSGIRLALDGASVVQLESPMEDTAPGLQEYLYLSPQGGLLGRLQVPMANRPSVENPFAVLAVWRNLLAATWSDSLGVEYVGVFDTHIN